MASITEQTTANTAMEKTVVMAGPTGAGKSSLACLLALNKEFAVSNSARSETKHHKQGVCDLDGVKVTLLDTVGLNDTDDDQMIIRSKLTQAIKSIKGGMDIFFFVLKLGRYTAADDLAFRFLCEGILGSKCFQNAYIVFTASGTQLLRDENARLKWIVDATSKNPRLARLLKDLDNKYIFIENPAEDVDEEQEAVYKKRRAESRAVLSRVVKQHSSPRFFFEMAQEAQKAFDAEMKRIEDAQKAATDEAIRAKLEIEKKKLQQELDAKVEAMVKQRLDSYPKPKGGFCTLL